MCDMLIIVELGQLGPISVLECWLIPLLPDLSALDRHSPLIRPRLPYRFALRSSLPHHHLIILCLTVPHHSSRSRPTSLISCYAKFIASCGVVHVHSSFHPSSLDIKSRLTRLLNVAHLLFHDPYCTGFYCISARCPLPRVHHVYVFVRQLSPRTILLYLSPFRCLPLHFPPRTIRLRSTLGGVRDMYKVLGFGSMQCRNTHVLLANPLVRFWKFSVRS